MLPANEWWAIIEAYGAAVWPAQVLFFFSGLGLSLFVFLSGKPIFSLLMKIYFTFSFGWISLVFFLTLGRGLAGSLFFSLLFMVIAILFALDSFRQRMRFGLPEVSRQKFLTLGLTLVVFGYPLISAALGRPLNGMIVPGTFPCPTTALAVVMLTTSLPKVNRALYLLLLFWAIPFAPFIQIPKYAVYEDAIMLTAGIYGFVMLLGNWKSYARVSGCSMAIRRNESAEH